MKKRLSWAVLCLVCAVSCGKWPTADNGTVRFRVSAPGGATRAIFSGDVNADGIERIDWERGDLLRIASPQAARNDHGTERWADYRIRSVQTAGSSSFGSIEPSGDTFLSWGEDDHDFYAVCPSPDGPDGLSGENRSYSGILPSEQSVRWEGCTGVPDPSLIILMAAAKDVPPESEVQLVFRPAFTALTFSLALDDKNPVGLHSFRLESRNGPLSGPFTIMLDGDTSTSPLPECAAVTCGEEASPSVTVNLDRILSRNEPVSFTVLCLPRDLSGLKAVFETEYGTKTLALNRKDGTPVVIPAGTKALVSGLVLPGAPDIRFTVEIVPWENDAREIEAVGPYHHS